MAKKSYPGGFRLTKKTAETLALREFGTAKGMEKDPGTDLEGYFTMKMGNLCVSIRPDIGGSGCIEMVAGMITANHMLVGYFNRETLEPDFAVAQEYARHEKREALEQWVHGSGPAVCHEMIDAIWTGSERKK